jgi:hypothetical protein
MVGFEKGKLYFYRRVGSSWDAELIERSSAGQPSLAYWGGYPAVAYRITKRNGDSSCWLARWNGSAWDKEVVDPSATCVNPQLALDLDGNPALAYLDDLEITPEWKFNDTLKFAYWDGTAWNVEIVDQPLGHHAFSPTVAYDPERREFSAAYESALWEFWPDGRLESGPGQVRFCERTAGSWICEVVEEADYVDVKGAWLTYDNRGMAFLAYSPMGSLKVATRAYGADAWVNEYVDWGTTSASIMLDPGGIPVIFYARWHWQSSPDWKSLRFARPIR